MLLYCRTRVGHLEPDDGRGKPFAEAYCHTKSRSNGSFNLSRPNVNHTNFPCSIACCFLAVSGDIRLLFLRSYLFFTENEVTGDLASDASCQTEGFISFVLAFHQAIHVFIYGTGSLSSNSNLGGGNTYRALLRRPGDFTSFFDSFPAGQEVSFSLPRVDF